MSVASPVRAASLADINAALADMGDLSGQFVQLSPGGETLQGDFFLALPDRFRFVYTQGRAQGGQNVVTLRGNWLVVQEFQGAEANRYPVSATPLHLLVDGRSLHIRPSQLEALTEKGGSIEVALRDPEGDVPGRLVLIFDSKTLALQGWRLLDIQQQRSTVWLHNVTRHARLAEDNFRIDESIAEAEDE
jgi:outer membrane lipoprotein-sorting protein